MDKSANTVSKSACAHSVVTLHNLILLLKGGGGQEVLGNACESGVTVRSLKMHLDCNNTVVVKGEVVVRN